MYGTQLKLHQIIYDTFVGASLPLHYAHVPVPVGLAFPPRPPPQSWRKYFARGDANHAVNIHKADGATERSICVTCLQVLPRSAHFLLIPDGAAESTMTNKELEQHQWPSVSHSPRSTDPPLRNHWRGATAALHASAIYPVQGCIPCTVSTS